LSSNPSTTIKRKEGREEGKKEGRKEGRKGNVTQKGDTSWKCTVSTMPQSKYS
jgi:predicted transposase YdaD